MKFTAAYITAAITGPGSSFAARRWLLCNNVSWGWRLRYEADVIAISAAGVCHEIEVKISRSDLINDLKKDKWKPGMGIDGRIAKFWYAVPAELADVAATLQPPGVPMPGIIVVRPKDPDDSRLFPRVEVVRKAGTIEGARRATERDKIELLRLASLRYWDEYQHRVLTAAAQSGAPAAE